MFAATRVRGRPQVLWLAAAASIVFGEQPRNQGAFGQGFVDLYCLEGLGRLNRDSAPFQIVAGDCGNLQLFVQALGQHHDGRPVGQQLLDASGLIPGECLVPVRPNPV